MADMKLPDGDFAATFPSSTCTFSASSIRSEASCFSLLSASIVRESPLPVCDWRVDLGFRGSKPLVVSWSAETNVERCAVFDARRGSGEPSLEVLRHKAMASRVKVMTVITLQTRLRVASASAMVAIFSRRDESLWIGLGQQEWELQVTRDDQLLPLDYIGKSSCSYSILA